MLFIERRFMNGWMIDNARCSRGYVVEDRIKGFEKDAGKYAKGIGYACVVIWG